MTDVMDTEPYVPTVEHVVEHLKLMVCPLNEPWTIGGDFHTDHGHTPCLMIGWAIKWLLESQPAQGHEGQASSDQGHDVGTRRGLHEREDRGQDEDDEGDEETDLTEVGTGHDGSKHGDEVPDTPGTQP